MKYIITEDKFPIYLLRRISVIKDKIVIAIQNLFDDNELRLVPFEQFLLYVSAYVATEMANEINGEDFVTIRNQIKQFIRTYFYEDLKEYWESKQSGN